MVSDREALYNPVMRLGTLQQIRVAVVSALFGVAFWATYDQAVRVQPMAAMLALVCVVCLPWFRHSLGPLPDASRTLNAPDRPDKDREIHLFPGVLIAFVALVAALSLIG